MNHRTAKAATAMTCALSLLAACGETTAGTPTSANGDTTTTATKSSSPKPSSERPRDITLDGKDPCGLTPQSDWAKFELDKPGKSKENQTFNVPECFYSSSMGGFSILLNTTEGIEAWDESHR
ncbi:DUF3558 family protein, partial [Actinokineospora sp.]|uniref:DUF3558 family protein n=1 Tax=Actinokineospora sp. TaxID=1872133 RepID=UPI003D6BECF9